MRANVIVTGGAGFIGSHICKALHAAGFQPVAYDNLSTGHADSVRWGKLIEGEMADTDRLADLLESCRPAAVIHCAASAYVGESMENPSKYYRNNVTGGLSLLDACLQTGIRSLVFSSSCATYGATPQLPLHEASLQQPVNPYGRSKLILEMALADYAMAYGLRYVSLRYFNAAGADPAGELSERHDPETHLIPRALLAASGQIDRLDVYGWDYPTKDGTCVRDYVHVSDLADAHVAAVHYLQDRGNQSRALNLGTGEGHSIAAILRSIHKVTGRQVPVSFASRRKGDPAVLVADSSEARRVLGFSTSRSRLETLIRTAAPGFGLRVLS